MVETRFKWMAAALVAASIGVPQGLAATNNHGKAPALITIDLCSNGIGDSSGSFGVPRLTPEVFDIGIDVGADGTIDRWLSKEPATWLGGGNSDIIRYQGWVRLSFFQLSEYVGQPMRIRIVDKSPNYYLAINSIVVNGADGVVVTNVLKNGSFESQTPLEGWKVLESSVSPSSKLVVADAAGELITYGKQFLSTRTDPASSDSSETAVIESETFVLPGITSFIVGNVSGGASEFVNNAASNGSDNASGVYLDLGTATQDPNGRFDPETDIALRGFWPGLGTAPANDFGTVLINTSGLEGRRAQIVGFDDSAVFHVALDAFRMNWDWEESIIKNGGFDAGVPTPQSHPDALAWFAENGTELTPDRHPSGKIPNWTVIKKAGGTADAFFFDASARRDHMTGRTYVGTGGGDRSAVGVEIRSDVFTLAAIPDPATSPFVQFASAQGTDRIRYTDDGTDIAFGRVELIVDSNGNGTFGEEGDFRYVQRNQSMALNQSNSGRDLWHYPEYRFYIRPEHRGKQAVFRAEDRFGAFKASWGWFCIDDLFVWDGTAASLAFPNSDFETGTLDNWTAEIDGGSGFNSWLSGTRQALDAGLVTHATMNNRSVSIDGQFAVDTAARETGGGDGGVGRISSKAFALPQVSAPAPLTLGIARVAQGIRVTWDGTATLEKAERPDGPWSTVTTGAGPYEVGATEASLFLRLRR